MLAVNSNRHIPDSKNPNHHANKKNSNGDPNASKVNNKNFKTKHCKQYHSDSGCGRGDACHFIHDVEYKGRPAPALEKSGGNQGKFNPKNSNSHGARPNGGPFDFPGTYNPNNYLMMQLGGSQPSSMGSDNMMAYPHYLKPGSNFSVTNNRPDGKPNMPTLPNGFGNYSHPFIKNTPPPPGPPAPKK